MSAQFLWLHWAPPLTFWQLLFLFTPSHCCQLFSSIRFFNYPTLIFFSLHPPPSFCSLFNPSLFTSNPCIAMFHQPSHVPATCCLLHPALAPCHQHLLFLLLSPSLSLAPPFFCPPSAFVIMSFASLHLSFILSLFKKTVSILIKLPACCLSWILFHSRFNCIFLRSHDNYHVACFADQQCQLCLH